MRAITAAIMLLACGALLFVVGYAAWEALTDLPGRQDLERASVYAGRSPTAPPASAPSTGTPPAVVTPRADATAGGDPRPAAGEADSRVRFIEEDGIVSIRVDGPLERAPAAPIEEPPPPPPKEEPDLYRLVVIESAGEIDVRTHKVRLAKVAAPDVDMVCRNAAGASWPCGRRARTALRRLIRRRAIECFPTTVNAEGNVVRLKDAPPPQKGEVRPAACSVANTDLARWLMENGWAAPTDTTPDDWLALHDAARTAGLGLYDPDGR